MRVGLDGRRAAEVRSQAHAHVVQQESAAEHKCLGRVELEAVAADQRCGVPERVGVRDRMVGEHGQGPGDLCS